MADHGLEIEIEIAQLKETISQLQAAASVTERGTEANKVHGKSVLELVEHSRGFHRALHAITEQAPLLGLALQSALSGPGAAIAALMVAMHALRHAQEEAKKAAEESAESQTKSFMASEESAGKAVDKIHEIRVAREEFTKSLVDNSHKERNELDLNIAKLKAEADAIRELSKAQGKPTEGVDFIQSHAELGMTQQTLAKITSQLATAKTAEEKANAAAEAGIPKTTAAADEAKVRADAARQAEEKARTAATKSSPTGFSEFMRSVTSGTPLEGMFDKAARQGEFLAEAERQKRLKDNAENTEKRARAEQDRLDQERKTAQDRVKSFQQQHDELSKKVQEMGGRVGMSDIGQAMAGTGLDPLSSVVTRGAAGMRGGLSAFGLPSSFVNQNAAQDLQRTLSAVFKGDGGMIRKILDIVASHNGDIANLAADVDYLKSQAAKTRAQMKGSFAQ